MKYDTPADRKFPSPAERSSLDPVLAEKILLSRLGRYLERYPCPTQLPLLKLLPSLNRSRADHRPIKFTETTAAELLKALGAILEMNPHYLGRSRYRITIPSELAARARNQWHSESGRK